MVHEGMTGGSTEFGTKFYERHENVKMAILCDSAQPFGQTMNHSVDRRRY